MDQAGTCAVKSHDAGRTPEGIWDLAGNVAELVTVGKSGNHAIRGGSWGSLRPEDVAVDASLPAPGEGRGQAYLGFRCVRDPAPARGAPPGQ